MVVPKAPFLLATTVKPEATLKVSSNVLAPTPERMSVPPPDTSMLVPVLLEITPEKVVVLST